MHTPLDTNNNTELCLTRHGWLSPEYELTDQACSYGKMLYSGISKRSALIETAVGTWAFRPKELLSRTILIINGNGEVIGEITRDWFSRTSILTLNDGFSAKFYRPSIWSRQYIWEAGNYGEIMHMKSNILSLKTYVSIKVNAPASITPLLIFAGAYLIILRRRKKAAH